MTTITINRATVEQALEALESVYGDSCDALHALRAALAQQADPTDPGHDVDVLREHVRHLERRVRELHAQQALQEPVGRVVSANCEYATVQWLKQTSDVGGGDPKNSRSWPIAGDAVYTAPPQRKPLPKHDQHCVDVPGYGLMAVRLVRAVERAHGIGEGA